MDRPALSMTTLMSGGYKFPEGIRKLIQSALPEDTSLHGHSPELRHIYLPASHAKALRPDSALVVGIRGAGKSFWWAALQQQEHVTALGALIGLSADTTVSTGFGERSSPDDYPDKDTIGRIRQRFDARMIWRTVALWHLSLNHLEEFRSLGRWSERVEWVSGHPEEVGRCLFEVDQKLASEKRYHLILFDALDRTADDWKSMHDLVRGLLQVLLDLLPCRRIRLKVFVRPDQLEDPSVTSFTDASKVLSQRTDLTWARNDLYGLLWQYLANDEVHGRMFRQGCEILAQATWEAGPVWTVPEELRSNEDQQRIVFHAITGPWMGRDRRRGFPYTWLPNHLADARRQVSPRSFLAAIRHAASDPPRAGQEYALHYESIKRGVQEASRIRVREIEEDYPWVRTLLNPLSGISVPCPFSDIQRIWEERNVLNDLQASIERENVRLPPAHIDSGPRGVLEDLMGLGLMEQISGDRVNLPDVYRVGYGIGRRGGVRPVR